MVYCVTLLYIQDRKLSHIRDNIVTVAVTSISERGIYKYSSESSCDSDISELGRKKLIPTTEKKKEEHSNLPITASIPFNLNMVDTLEPLLEHILKVILKATSPGSDIRKMLAANELKEYDTFRR